MAEIDLPNQFPNSNMAGAVKRGQSRFYSNDVPDAPPFIAATWNPLDKSSNVSLSASNLVVTGTGAGSVRANVSKTTGKFYWEATFTTAVNGQTGVGVSNSAYSLTGPTIGSGSNGAGTSGANTSGVIVVEGVVKNGMGGLIGATVCIALDLTNKLIWYRALPGAGNWNASGDPVAGTGGYALVSLGGANPAYPTCSVGVAGDQITANFGPSGFVGVVPTGFTAGWG